MVMHHRLLAFLVIVAVLIISILAYGYWQTMPYANYKINEAIDGFPFESTSMTVIGFATAPDVTFPAGATDIFVNVTVQRLASPNQGVVADTSGKHLFLRYQAGTGHGEVSAWNDSDSLGINTPDNELNSLSVNQSVDGTIRFVLGNDNYSSFQLVCRADSQQKPLFIVDLHA